MPSLLQQQAKKELAKRRGGSDSAKHIETLRKLLSPQQLEFLDDSHRFKILRCGRRAGKSFVDAVYMIIECLKAGRMPCLYLGLTRDSAKEIIWPILLMILEELKIPHTAIESSLSIKFSNGSSIKIMGADMKQMAARMRGRKHRLIVVDEMAFFTGADKLIKSLIPSLADLAGIMVMTSSPGNLLHGLFYEADVGKDRAGWRQYHWTMLENPYYMKPATDPRFKTKGEQELFEICRDHFKGDREHPLFRQEYLGIWVSDDRNLIYPIAPLNVIPQAYLMEEQEHAIGLNLSAGSQNAVVVVRFGRYSREVQFIDTWSQEDATIDQLAIKLQELTGRYRPLYVVAKTGQYGEGVITEMVRRYPGLSLQAAEETDKTFHQRIMRSDLMSNNIKVIQGLPILEEWRVLTRESDDEEIKGPPNHLSDAALEIYRKIYVTYLKSYEPKLTEEQKMLKYLEEDAVKERQEREEDLLY